MNTKLLLLTAVSALGATATHAATISWTVHNIANDLTQVQTVGTLHASAMGANGGDGGVSGVSGDATTLDVINGVPFADISTLDSATNQDNIGGRAGSYPSQPNLPGNRGFRQLLEHGSRNTANANQSITFTGLTSGHQYLIQIWGADNGGTAGTQGVALGNGVGTGTPTFGTDPTLLWEVTEGGYGQYALGLFVADSATQSFLVRKWNNLTTTPVAGNNTYVNAWQIRDLGAIPEQSTALAGILLGLGLLRRRRA